MATSTYRRTTRLMSLTTTTADTIGAVALAELVLHEGPGKSLHSPVADPGLADGNQRHKARLAGEPHQLRLGLQVLRQVIDVGRDAARRDGAGDGAGVDGHCGVDAVDCCCRCDEGWMQKRFQNTATYTLSPRALTCPRGLRSRSGASPLASLWGRKHSKMRSTPQQHHANTELRAGQLQDKQAKHPIIHRGEAGR